MKRWMARIALVTLMSSAAVPFATVANAMTCEINDGDHTDPDVGDTACQVFLTAISPVCAKFHCG